MVATVHSLLHAWTTVLSPGTRYHVSSSRASASSFSLPSYPSRGSSLFLASPPRDHPIQKFGSGSFRTKLALIEGTPRAPDPRRRVPVSAQVLTPVRLDSPAWFHSKVCFYIFNYTIEILVVFAYTGEPVRSSLLHIGWQLRASLLTGGPARDKGLRFIGVRVKNGSSSTVVEGREMGHRSDETPGARSRRSSIRNSVVGAGFHENPAVPPRDAA